MRVLAHTSALLSVSAAADRSHSAATAAWNRLASERPLPITTNYVVGELRALLKRRLGMGAVRGFVNRIQPVLELHWVDEATHEAGMARLPGGGRRGRASWIT